MEAWMDRNHKIMYQHYEKAVSSRPVLHAESTQSCECKHNVHVQELLRRVLNTSSNLDWDIVVAPFLSDYMGRMMQAGYGQEYRQNTLVQALGIYDRMKLENVCQDNKQVGLPHV